MPAFLLLLLLPLAGLKADTAVRPTASASELLSRRSAQPASFREEDLNYLLARRAEVQGDLGLATAAFVDSSVHSTTLQTRAQRHLAGLARSSGNLTLERLYLVEAAFLGVSEQRDKAVWPLARSNFDSGNYLETIRLLTGITTRQVSSQDRSKTKTRDAEALLAQAYSRAGDHATARRLYSALLISSPDAERPDDAALVAAIGLDTLDEAAQNTSIAAADHMARGHVYQFNREFASARRHYQAVIAAEPSGGTSAEAIFQIGRGHAQETNYVEALHWFERAIEQFPGTDAAREALLNAAAAYSRVGKQREAITRYELFIVRYPGDSRLDRAHLNIVDILRDQGQDTEALRKCQEIRGIFRGTNAEATALFSEARIHLANDQWEKAIGALTELAALPMLGGLNVPGGTTLSEVKFLLGYANERSGKLEAALAHYLSIPDTAYEYHAGRSNLRIQSLLGTPEGNEVVTRRVRQVEIELNSQDAERRLQAARHVLRLANSGPLFESARRIAIDQFSASVRGFSTDAKREVTHARPVLNRLEALGLYDEAADLLAGSAPTIAADLQTFVSGDRADIVMSIVEPTLSPALRSLPAGAIPREQLALVYPIPFRDRLREVDASSGVDPRLILAIMRQESRFRADARSESAARGLMQFTAPTAERIARRLDMAGLEADDLYSPSTSILLGSEYLNELFTMFPEQPEAVAASYNGGEDNMKRWLNRSRSNEPDRYVPEIQYSQSKDYVFKVISAYQVYQYLYDRDLELREG